MNIESTELICQIECHKALTLMESALEILDRIDGMDDVGAHLDLAICRYKLALANSEVDQLVVSR